MFLSLLGLVLFLSVGMVSAKTLITGKIYNFDYSQTIAGANVVVDCNGNIQTTTSASDGSYVAVYNETGDGSCDSGDALVVNASHSSYGFGSLSGTINDDAFMEWDLAIVNVPLVPEFGFFICGLTILGVIGIFFLVRRQ